ncbi:MAG: division/cell wall cluster transcriptional repressor MraZ [candidate division WOR-3 bacterium]|nr:division/cell wall cluster transcriptional repressor MraZ [candidate division WOR-3 bacterium]
MVEDSYDFLFVGDHTHAVDTKNRVAIPLSFRRSFPSGTEDHLVLLRGATGCIEAHVRPEWRLHIQRFKNLGLYNKEDLTLRRLLLSGATEIELDGQARVLLPKRLTELAGIGAEARFIGLGPFFEIWNPRQFDDFVAQNSPLYDGLIERLDGSRSVEEKAAECGGQDQRGVPSAGNAP